MSDSFNCPNCGTPVRVGAKFCPNCGAAVDDLASVNAQAASQSVTRPVAAMGQSRSTTPFDSPNGAVTRQLAVLPATPASARPPGAIIAGLYRVTGISFDDGKLFEYPVVEFHVPEEDKALQCANGSCGAIHWKAAEGGDYPARYCTECSAPMDVARHPDLRLTETVDPTLLGRAPEVAALGLIHGSIRAPMVSSSELVNGQRRTWIVESHVDPLPPKMERKQAALWTIGLAAGLETLHQRGVFFDGQVTDACLGVSGDHAVWAHFASCSTAPETPDTARRADARALAGRLFQWLTGREQVSQEATFSPGMNAFFAQAVASPGFTSAAEMGQALEKALQDARSGMVVSYHSGRKTDVGKVRELNEDSMLTIETARFSTSNSRPGGIYAVADGMGGHSAGEVASSAIVNFIQGRCLTEMSPVMAGSATTDWLAWLKETVEAVNKHVFDLRKSSGTDMGSTLVMAMLDGPRAYIAHVGDSRAYLVNSREIRRLTVDHSLVERLVATGQIRREEAQHHPQKNVIYRTIGDKPRLDVDASVVDLSVGDRLMLCSDGLCGLVEDGQMQKLVMGAPSPQAACEALVSAANAAGGDDNISVIVVEIIRG